MGGWPARCGVEELTPLTGGGAATLVTVSIRNRHSHKQFQGRALSSVEGARPCTRVLPVGVLIFPWRFR